MIERFNGSFVAVDQDGNKYEIFASTQVVDTNHLRGQGHADGMQELRLASGEHVNYRKRGEYQLLDGRILTSDSPDAP